MARSPLVMLALVAFLTAAGLLVSAGANPTRAQEDAGPQIETLMEFTLEDQELPAAPSFLRLLRITLEPGAKSPLHTHPGPEFNIIQDGTFRVLVQGKALLNGREGAGTPETGTVQPPDGEFIMRSAEAIAYMPGTAMTFRNSGSSDAVMLAAVVQPAGNQRPPGLVWVGQAPTEEELAGLTSQVLGDGVATALPEGQTVMRLERMTLQPGQAIPAFSGPVMLSLAEGALEFTVQGGSVQVSRTADDGPRPDAELGTAFSLAIGDAAFFPNGNAEAARSNEEGDLILFRLTISTVDQGAQASPVAAEPGVIEITTPPRPSPTPEPTVTPTPEATPEPEPAVIKEGATVVVTEDSVRVRTGPSTDTEIVGAVDTGRVLVVTGPSQEGNDFVWWPVEDPNDPAVAGFIAADFIEVQEEEEEEAEE
ncbi:MAG: SH3 domain-containing protein [Thermomicrobiales bacterium]